MLRFARFAMVAASVLATVAGSAPASSTVALPGDGLIAFVDTATYAPAIGVIASDGTGRHLVTRSNPPVESPTWSPDGKEIAYVRGNSIVLIRPGGGVARPIATTRRRGGLLDPVWSSRGTLAFWRVQQVAGNPVWTIATMHADGTDAHTISVGPSAVTLEQLIWSSDGRRLLLERFDAKGRPGILAIDPVSGRSTVRQLPAHCSEPPVRAPQGGISACTGGSRIWLLRSGHPARPLVVAGADIGGTPAWNAQGTRLAVGLAARRVAVVSIPSGHRRIYAVPDAYANGAPVVSWSPNGHRLVVGTGWRIAILELATGQVRTLAEHSEDSSPQFSPDGTSLAYLRASPNAPGMLRVTRDLAQGGITVATDLPGQQPNPTTRAFAWSPDSSTIAYRSTSGALETVDAATRVTRTLAPISTGSLAWSRDGETLAYGTTVATAPAIGFVHPDGSASSIALITGFSNVLDWTSDGEHILAFQGLKGIGNMALVRAYDGRPSATFAYLSGYGSALSPDGSRVLLSFLSQGGGGDTSYATALATPDGRFTALNVDTGGPAVWSPDGRFILQTLRNGGDTGTGAHDDTRTVLAIAPTGNPNAYGPTIANADTPSWQPLPGRAA